LIVKTVNCTECLNTDCFVKLCSEEWIRKIDYLKSHAFYKKDQNVFNEGFQIFGIFFIREGKVKIYTSGLNNKEQIVRFAADGDILGHRAVGNDFYPVTAAAMDDSHICFIKNDVLNQIFLANPQFLIELMMYYSAELRKLERRIKNIVQMNLQEKTAETLLLMLDKFGLNDLYELNVPFSREDFAETAGTTRQQIVMQLTEFEKEGLIEKRGKKIALINIRGLQKIINSFTAYKYQPEIIHKSRLQNMMSVQG